MVFGALEMRLASLVSSMTADLFLCDLIKLRNEQGRLFFVSFFVQSFYLSFYPTLFIFVFLMLQT